jgi:predicted dehydrogenase
MDRPVPQELRFALIGAGFIGKSHALAIHAVNRVFPDLPMRARAHILAELDPARAQKAARDLGFEAATSEWRQAVDRADAVIIAVPSHLHYAVASYAIAAGKPILCEKPVGLSSEEAARLAAAAGARTLANAVGFTYLRAPMVQYAKLLLDSGRLGAPLHIYARHAEDYFADPATPFSWRMDASLAGRCGALGDLGYHILAIMRLLCGPVQALSGQAEKVHRQRPVAAGSSTMRAVENEDYAGALLRFAGGARGMFEASRIAQGRKMDLCFELTCERGSLRYDAERNNELKLFFAGEDATQAGFRTILANPSHPNYGGFLPAPGHGLGFNDLKTIELKTFLEAIAGGVGVYPDLGQAACISRLCEGVLDSASSGRWIENVEAPMART